MRLSRTQRPRRLVPTLWAAGLAGATLLLPLPPATGAGASPGALTLRVTSSVGRVIGTGSCRLSSAGDQVVASGPVTRRPVRSLTVTLDVYSAEGSPLDLLGGKASSTLPAGSNRWRVAATIVQGFAPVRCVVHVTVAEHLERIRVTGSSMTPTIKAGSWAVVNLSAFTSAQPKAGDIVAIRAPKAACTTTGQRSLILRVVALGGQSIEGVSGNLFVDGHQLVEPWLPKRTSSRTPPFAQVDVASGSYFLLGDDRARACDSRDFGAVPTTDILGKVVKVVGQARATPTPNTYSNKEVTPAFTT